MGFFLGFLVRALIALSLILLKIRLATPKYIQMSLHINETAIFECSHYDNTHTNYSVAWVKYDSSDTRLKYPKSVTFNEDVTFEEDEKSIDRFTVKHDEAYNNYVLTIEDIQERDGGLYECILKNKPIGEMRREVINLEVHP